MNNRFINALGPTVILSAFLLGCSPDNKFERAAHQTVLVAADQGTGSGFVIRRGNRFFVWTAAHVADQSDLKIKLFIRNEHRKVGTTEFSAKLLARDAELDLALLWVDAPPGYVTGAELSEDLTPGDPIFHVGNFLGESFDGSVSTGIISQVGVAPTRFDKWPWPVADQTTLTAMPGSSGGPIFSADGKVIGILVGSVYPGANFFVPTRAIKQFATREALQWAVAGDECPVDADLFLLAKKNSIAKPLPVEHCSGA